MWRVLALSFILFASGAATSFAADPNYKVTVSGKGADVLMIPGLASSGDVWNATAEHLAPHFKVHVFTLAGFGGVPPVEGPFIAQRLAALDAYLKSGNINHATIIGHSLGGLIAMKLALLEPGRIDRLVIVDSLPFLAGGMLGAPNLNAVSAQLSQLRDGLKSAPRASFLAQEKQSIARLVTSPENQALVYSWAEISDQATIAEATYEDLSTDIRSEIGAIKAKVLMLYPWRAGGIYSSGQTDKLYADQFASIPSLTLKRIDNSLHFIMLDQPKAFDSAIDDFLK